MADDHGPWDEYDFFDGYKKDDIVGVRLKSDGPNGIIFTPLECESLPNPLCNQPESSKIYFEKNKIDPNKKIAFTCGSGMTACVLGLTNSIISGKKPVVYDGSWAEYGIK